MTSNPIGGPFVTADVSTWPTSDRVELLELIDTINARLAAGEGVEAAEATTLSPFVESDADAPAAVESSGWTAEAYVEAITALLPKNLVQAKVIMAGIKNGDGYVPREDVYVLGGYPETRTLKGFTRPVNRVVEDLELSGSLPSDAVDLLATVYDPAVKSFQRALGFQVPLEIVKIALEASAAQAAKSAQDIPEDSSAA